MSGVSLAGEGLTLTANPSGGIVTLQLAASAIGANGLVGTLPANAYILYATFRETSGHAVNVGLGTSAGAFDVLAPLAISASATRTAATDDLAANWFSSSATQAIFANSASWGSAVVNVSIAYQVGP